MTYATIQRLLPGRHRQHEHLDRTDLPAAERAASYADLDRLALLPGQLGPLARAVEQLARERTAGPRSRVRLLELGAGTGRVGLRIGQRLRRRGHDVDLHLTDIRPEMLPAASEADGLRVRTSRLDVIEDALPEADIVYASLLIHHLDDDDAVVLLGRMHQAGLWGGVIHDLDRSPFAFAALRILMPLLVRSPVTVADSLLSVQQAFRPAELLRLCRAAGIATPRATRHLGLRSRVVWRR